MKRAGMIRRTALKADPAKQRAWQDRSRKPLARKTRMKARNEKNIAKRHKAYAAVLRSAFHRKLRYLAWERSGGLCECDRCVEIRRLFARPLSIDDTGAIGPNDPTSAEFHEAHTPIPIWFVQGAGEAWQRFRCTEGHAHHESYRYMGQENPEELKLIRFVWRSHHARIEAEHGTRRRYLSGRA